MTNKTQTNDFLNIEWPTVSEDGTDSDWPRAAGRCGCKPRARPPQMGPRRTGGKTRACRHPLPPDKRVPTTSTTKSPGYTGRGFLLPDGRALTIVSAGRLAASDPGLFLYSHEI
jgi:hypothetical protein